MNYYLISFNGHEDLVSERNKDVTINVLTRMKVKFTVEVM